MRLIVTGCYWNPWYQTRDSIGFKPLVSQWQGLIQLQDEHKTTIGVSPGSVWGTKRWPLEYYQQLVKKILEDPHKQVVLLGSPDEKPYAESILQAVGSHLQLIDLCGKTSLAELPEVYQSLDMLIANDSSPIHYASAHGVPTVAIFGATVPAMGFGPKAKGSIVVDVDVEDLACRPCSDHGPKHCPLKHFQCMKNISVNRVLEAVDTVLKEKSE